MRERPILFSAPMVRAILEGRKTQTRRVVKPQPDWPLEVCSTRRNTLFWPIGALGQQCGTPLPSCPYGQPGDRLWVRETHALCGREVRYRADQIHPDDYPGANFQPWRPSIHMPRWASRILLEVTDVRVQRLQEISEAESRAEGIIQYDDDIGYGTGYPDTDPNLASTGIGAFRNLWDSINGASAWTANPWVWAVSFQRMTP